MLPSLLSEHLCSLREGQDRLAVSVIWTLTPQFDVADIWSGRTIIRYSLHRTVLRINSLQCNHLT